MGRIIALALVCCTLLHCAKRDRSYTNVAAPANEEDLGFIVTVTDEKLHQIEEKHPEAEIRAISPAHGIYEVVNVPQQSLVNIVGPQNLDKNFFIQARNLAQPKITLDSLILNTSKDATSAIQTCQMGKAVPGIKFQVSFDMKRFTVKLGETVKLSAIGTAHPSVGGSVRFMWDMMPPMFSQQAFTQGIGDTQEFKPDSVGLYRIALVGQGADLTCDLRVIPVLVTDNPQPQKISPSNLSVNTNMFSQLAAIDAINAWKEAKGTGVTVAVLDSGLNYNHVGIANNVALDDEEVIDAKDNDNNRYKDDYIGWDFINADNLPYDDNGHGSHVSGLIASPFMGIAPDAKILPVKVINAAGGGDLGSITAGIYYAVDKGANIINASIGLDSITSNVTNFSTVPQTLQKALEYAKKNNVLVITAAGNGDQRGVGIDIKKSPIYPASLQLDNLMTVAATSNGHITRYSNFSAELVHIGAPGGEGMLPLYSLATQNPANAVFAPMEGTSMASPVVAGVAALVMSKNVVDPLAIRTLLMETGDELATLKASTISGRQVNAKNAVQKALQIGSSLAIK